MAKAKDVEEYIEAHLEWKEELLNLRSLLTSFAFEETIKWGGPVYTYNGKNVVGLAGFKNHYALWFFNGNDLKDNTALLHNAQEGKTKTLRQIRFTKDSGPNIVALKPYIEEAINVAEEGKTSKPGQDQNVKITSEFIELLNRKPNLKSSFNALSPGKQREYIAYISEAKRVETKEKRFEKISPLIEKGKGLNDRYKK